MQWYHVANATVNSYLYWDFQTSWNVGLQVYLTDTDIAAPYTHLTLMIDHSL
jgi:hypothetical protein